MVAEMNVPRWSRSALVLASSCATLVAVFAVEQRMDDTGSALTGSVQSTNDQTKTIECINAGYNACLHTGCSCQTMMGITTCTTVPFPVDSANKKPPNACYHWLNLTNNCNKWNPITEWVDPFNNRHSKCDCTEEILCDTANPPSPKNNACIRMQKPRMPPRYMCIADGLYCCKGRQMANTGLPKCIDAQDASVMVMGKNMSGYEACQFVQGGANPPAFTTLAQCNADCKDCSDWPGYTPPATTLPNIGMTCAAIDGLKTAMETACNAEADCAPCMERLTGKHWKCDGGAGSSPEGYFLCATLMMCPQNYQPSPCQQPSPPAYCSDTPVGGGGAPGGGMPGGVMPGGGAFMPPVSPIVPSSPAVPGGGTSPTAPVAPTMPGVGTPPSAVPRIPSPPTPSAGTPRAIAPTPAAVPLVRPPVVPTIVPSVPTNMNRVPSYQVPTVAPRLAKPSSVTPTRPTTLRQIRTGTPLRLLPQWMRNLILRSGAQRSSAPAFR